MATDSRLAATGRCDCSTLAPPPGGSVSSAFCWEDRFAALFLLELTTGIRRGQLCGLKWSNVDLDGRQITVHDNRVVVAGHARDKAGGKTENADQTISIDRATASALETWRGIQVRERDFLGTDYHAGDYVFTFADGRPPHPDTIRQRFDRLAAAAGLSRITFHDLRHSYATDRCPQSRDKPESGQPADRPRQRRVLPADLCPRAGQ
jgi:integrase